MNFPTGTAVGCFVSRLGEPPWVLQYSQLASCQSGSITTEQPAEKKNFSKAEVLKMLDLPEMQNLLRQKRLRWVGHALRRKDGDLSKDTVKQELARKSSTWTACVRSDMEALNIGGVVALEREANNRESFRKLTSAYTQI